MIILFPQCRQLPLLHKSPSCRLPGSHTLAVAYIEPSDLPASSVQLDSTLPTDHQSLWALQPARSQEARARRQSGMSERPNWSPSRGRSPLRASGSPRILFKVSVGIFPKASLVGARSVNWPSPSSTVLRPAAATAACREGAEVGCLVLALCAL